MLLNSFTSSSVLSVRISLTIFPYAKFSPLFLKKKVGKVVQNISYNSSEEGSTSHSCCMHDIIVYAVYVFYMLK